MENENIQNLNPEELRDLKTQYNRAKEILEKINSLSIRYDAAFKAFDTRNIDVEKVSNEVREKAVLVENTKNESANLLAEIKSNLEKIQSNISQIEDATIKFEGIKGRIEGKEGEMDALLSAAKGLKNDVEKAKVAAQQRLTDIDTQFTQIQEKIALMQKAHDSFVALHAKITDSNTGLQAILDQSVDLQKQSNTTFTEIRSFHEQSKKYLELIKTNKVETDKIKNEAQQNLEEINQNKVEVEKITALITDTGFANSFQEREKKLRISAGLWMLVFLASVAGLAWMLYGFFSGVSGAPELNVILYRLTLTSPLLFLIGVAIKQYSNERSLNEKYAFKAAIAAVIRNHTKFLAETKTSVSPEDAQFVRETLDGIYVEPYERGVDVKEIKKDLKLILETKDSKIKTSLVDLVGMVKDIKTLVPDEVTLKSIMEIISKSK